MRTEEEKTQDMVLYEKKAKGGELVEKYEKTNFKAKLVTYIAAVVFALCAYPFFYKAYDTENILGMVFILLSVILLTVAARICTGAVLSRSLFTFIKWGSLSKKWRNARLDMHRIEAKFAEQTAFADDVEKFEKRLLDASEKLISFAEEKGIKTDE